MRRARPCWRRDKGTKVTCALGVWMGLLAGHRDAVGGCSRGEVGFMPPWPPQQSRDFDAIQPLRGFPPAAEWRSCGM